MKIYPFKSLFLFLVSLSILIFAIPGFAEDNAILVKCVDSSSNPIKGVKVVVVSLADQKGKDKKSDSKGEAEFTKLDNGTYRVIGRKDGFEPAFYEFVVLKGSTEPVTLKMKAGADRKLYFEDPARVQKAFGLITQALDLYKQNKFADAEKLLRQAIELDPSNPNALRYLGVTCIQQAKFDQGVEALNKAAEVSTALAAVPPGPGGPGPAQYQQIVEFVQRVLKQLPEIKGKAAVRQQKFDVAVAEFKKALEADPNNSELHSNLAVALANSHKYDEALASINKALQLNPGAKEIEDLKNKITAMKEKAETVKLNAVLEEGNNLYKKGDTAGALKKYEELRSMLPQEKQAPVWNQIGRVQAKLNQPDAAIQSFKKAIELAQDEKAEEGFRKSFAQFYMDEKKYDEALNVLTEAGNADPQKVEQALLSINRDFRNKEPQLAEVALERVIKLNPQNAEAYFELGQLYYIDGKEKDSRTKELLSKYLEIGKNQDSLKRAKDLMVVIELRNKK